MKLGVLHYRGRGRYAAGVAEPRLRRFAAIFRVARVRRELRRVIAGAAIRLMFPRRLLTRVRLVMVGDGALRDVVLVVMRIQDLVRRFGHPQIRDLVEAGLAVGCVEGGIAAPRRGVPLPALLRLAAIARRPLVLPVLPVTLVPPIRRVSARR